MRGIIVALSGPSGSGKTTVAEALDHEYRWVAVREAFDRIRPRPSLRIDSPAQLLRLELRLLREEARRYVEARSRARAGATVVADTSFLDPVNYTAGLLLLGRARPASFRAVVRRALALSRQGRLGLPDLTVHLSVPAATRRTRAERDCARHPPAFRERHESVGRVEDRLLLPAWSARFPGRFPVVRASGTAPSVALGVRRAALRTAPVREPCRAARVALEVLVRLPAVRSALDGSGNVKKGTLPPRPPL